MARWSCYTKIDQFVFLPMQSMGMAVTTFVGQNTGAGDIRRAQKGTYTGLFMSIVITVCGIIPLWIFAEAAMHMFSQDSSVIYYGVFFVRFCLLFITSCCFNQVLSGALRGVGDAKAPMVIMIFPLCFFVSFTCSRQPMWRTIFTWWVSATRRAGLCAQPCL